MGGFPRGNDAPYHLTWIFYLDRYFPYVPKWFYAQGGGFPFLASYPPLSTYVAFLVHWIFGVSIFDAFSLIAVVSIVATGLGLYFFVKVKFDNEFWALMSGCFILLTPAIWSTYGVTGAYSRVFSTPFITFVLAFLELRQRKNATIWFVMAVFAFTLSSLSHLSGGLVFGVLLVLTYFVAKLLSREISLKRALEDFVSLLLASLCLGAFWYLPLLLSRPEQVFGRYAPVVEFWSLREVLGLSPVFGVPHLSLAVNIFFLIGAILLVKQRGFCFWLLNATLLFIFASLLPRISAALGIKLGFPSEYVWGFWPFIIPAAILMSIVAGFSVAMVHKSLMRIAQSYSRSAWPEHDIRINSLIGLLIIAVLVFPTFHLTDPFSPNPYAENTFQSSHESTLIKARELLGNIELSNLSRIDLSPRLAPLFQTINILSDASIAGTYFIQGPLYHHMWVFEQSVLYGPTGGRVEVATQARWWGIEYVLLYMDADPVWKYENNSFANVYVTSYGGSKLLVLKYLNATDLVTVKKVPALLLIGSEKGAAFQYFFLNTVQIGYDCEDFYPIQGGEYVDDYSLEDLKTFDTVFLHGYNYRDSNKAWKLLRDYVSEGGSLIINTGWQYESADWSNPTLPEPSPVKKTFWTDYGKEWRLIAADHPITKGINFSDFSPPIWGAFPWGLSSTDNESLRQWAQPILWNHGHPLIVIGRYGEGKVVWQGIDLRAHSSMFSNPEEYKFVRRIIDWTMRSALSKDIYDISRPTPDKMVVDVREASEHTVILFREAYHPNWHSYIEKDGLKNDLKIYKVGPGFMFVRMPNVSPPFRVTFRYEKSLLEWGSIGISMLALGVLVTYTAIGLKRKGELETVYRPANKRKGRRKGANSVKKSNAELV